MPVRRRYKPTLCVNSQDTCELVQMLLLDRSRIWYVENSNPHALEKDTTYLIQADIKFSINSITDTTLDVFACTF